METARLDEKILAYLAQGVDHQDEEGFNRLALEEFALQYRQVAAYREYCRRKGVAPDTVCNWRQIPAVPSAAFKTHILASFPLERAVQSNITSGTTGRKNRGRVYRDQGALEMVLRANALLTKTYLFPDVDRLPVLLLAPSPRLAPSMGMAIGLEQVRRRFGTADSAFLVSRTGLEVKKLVRALVRAEQRGEPLALIGATACFIYLFKACKREKVRFRLPAGSRICDAGGYYGQFGECSKEEYVTLAEEILGVPPSHNVNVLGTAECSTNYFDNTLRQAVTGLAAAGTGSKLSPPWTRTVVVDPATLEELPPGEPGLLRHYDLANRAMVLGVQTDNLGVGHEKGFEILGRWSKERGGYVMNYSGGMPQGRVVTTLTGFLLRRGLNGIGRLHARIRREQGVAPAP